MQRSKTTLSVFFSIVAMLAIFVCVKMVQADTGSNGYGYLWSSNIGWIKLNDCDDPRNSATCDPSASYGVSAAPNGVISGYAWSSNIGWITFNDPSCPTSGCTAGARVNWTTGAITGWARACSIYDSGCSGQLTSASYAGTWDGYIALDSTTGGGSGGAWGLHVGSNKSITGYAWGSEVIGWIQSISAGFALTGVQLVANPPVIVSGASSTLTATAPDIDGSNACSIAGVPGLTMAQSAGTWTGSVVVSPAGTTTYTVTCTKSGQSFSANATVTVLSFGFPGGPGSGPGGGYCAITNPQLQWDGGNAASCTISEQGGGSVSVASSSRAAGGTLATDGLYYATVNLPVGNTSGIYTLQCTGGSTPVNLQVTVPACVKDFTLIPEPASANFVADANGKDNAVFAIGVDPQNGFTDTVSLSVDSWPSNMPKSRTAVFAPVSLSSSGGAYGTSSLTISVNSADLKKIESYTVVIKGISSGGIVRRTSIIINAVDKLKPIFNEF